MTVDIADLQTAGFAAPKTAGIDRHQQCPVEEIPRRVEKPAYFLDTQNDRKPPPILSGIGKIFFHVPALERFAVKKSDRADALDYCPNGQFPLLQQMGVISPKVVGIYCRALYRCRPRSPE